MKEEMNDTHGVEGKGWYGFDLDGTLAKYDGWKGIDHIGEPVELMVARIKKMHDEGKVVKILTARVAPRSNPETATTRYPLYAAIGGDVPEYVARIIVGIDPDKQRSIESTYARAKWTAKDFITDWCLEHLGFLPEITHEKDHLMLELYDDRVKQVVPNEGLLVEDLYRECMEMLKQSRADSGWLLTNLESRCNKFLTGMLVWGLFVVLTFAGIEAYNTWFNRENEPMRVRLENAHKALHDLLNDWPEGVR